MRPLRLELQGFSAYRSLTTIDFAEHDLIVFTGPTGAGKSSIIDGMVFALYGSVARYDNENLVAPIINALATEARIRFDFSVGEKVYTAVRVVRRTASGASTKEARLECGDEVLASSAHEVTAEVERVLGLSFSQFTKTVVLPQGDFARFLTESPKTRQLLLRRLLGLDVFASIGQHARRRSRQLAAEAKTYERVLTEGTPVTKTEVASLRKAFDALDAAQERIGGLVVEREETLGLLRVMTEHVSSLDADLAALTALVLPPEATRFARELAKAEATIDSAQKTVQRATEKHEAALAKRSDYRSIIDLESLLAAHGQLVGLDDELANLVETHGAAQDHLDAAIANAEERSAAVAAANDVVEHARIRAGALGIAATLHTGDECPVCERIIDVLPSHSGAAHDGIAEVEHAEAERDAALEAAKTAMTAVTQATKATAEFDARVKAATKTRHELADRLDSEPTEKQSRTQLARALAADEKVATATEALATTQEALERAEETLAHAAASATTLRRQFTEARDTVAALSPPSPGEESLQDDWSTLVTWAEATAIDLRAERTKQTKHLVSSTTSLESTERMMLSVSSAFLAPGATTTVDASMKVVANAHADARVVLANAEDRLARQNTQSEQLVAVEQERTVADELGKHLASGMFERWIMTDVMHDLAGRASGYLTILSAGSFSLITSGTDFQVRDHRNADELRNARTLSGGETFLTSLSLSLALAESITELASSNTPPLESMFLDEGFGTLDPETLDTVAAAIEELGASGRMIGIVTHINELAERLPTRFDVQRGPNGATVQLHARA